MFWKTTAGSARALHVQQVVIELHACALECNASALRGAIDHDHDGRVGAAKAFPGARVCPLSTAALFPALARS